MGTYVFRVFDKFAQAGIFDVDIECLEDLLRGQLFPRHEHGFLLVEVAHDGVLSGRLDEGVDVLGPDIAHIREIEVVRFSEKVTIVSLKLIFRAIETYLGCSHNEIVPSNPEHRKNHMKLVIVVLSCVDSVDQMRLFVQEELGEHLFPGFGRVLLEHFACVLPIVKHFLLVKRLRVALAVG